MKFIRTKNSILNNEIKTIQSRLQLRRTNIMTGRSQLKHDFINQLTSPKSFVLAFSTGFVMGELFSKNKPKLVSKQSNYLEQKAPISNLSPVSRVAQYLSMTYSFMNTWPSSMIISKLRQHFSSADKSRHSNQS